eukprot:gene35998-46769_t
MDSSRGRAKVVKAAQPQNIKGRTVGVPNYKANILLNIIEDVMPIGAAMWQTVTARYHVASREPNLRDWNDVKRKFFELHKCGKAQPTGTKTVNATQARALSIYRSILKKDSFASIGGADDNVDGDGGEAQLL